LYNGHVTYIRIGDGLSSACLIGRGVKQGCSLSQLLCLIYEEAMIREATDTGLILRHNDLLHEIMERTMKGKPISGSRRLQILHDLTNGDCYLPHSTEKNRITRQRLFHHPSSHDL